MKDVEKLKKEYELKLRIANIENETENAHPEITERGISFHMYDGIHEGEIRCFFEKGYTRKLSIEDTAAILNALPANESLSIKYTDHHQPKDTDYDLEIQARPLSMDDKTYLEIKWKHSGVIYSTELRIDKNSPIIDLFKETYRKLTESEISSYGIQKTRFNKDYRDYFPFYTFAKGEVIHYVGGIHRLTDTDTIHEIINRIKNIK